MGIGVKLIANIWVPVGVERPPLWQQVVPRLAPRQGSVKYRLSDRDRPIAELHTHVLSARVDCGKRHSPNRLVNQAVARMSGSGRMGIVDHLPRREAQFMWQFSVRLPVVDEVV